jgi:hypothetical protein
MKTSSIKMELKRYVLLNKNVIYDTKDFDDVKKFSMDKNSSHLDYQVKATSDNILDLVEKDDWVKDTLELQQWLLVLI